MSIPDKAVEAAAREQWRLNSQKLSWDDLAPVKREKLRLDANAVLEAAEPYLRGQVAEEIAVALETRAVEWATPSPTPEGWDSHHIIVRGANQTAMTRAAGVAREIGGKS